MVRLFVWIWLCAAVAGANPARIESGDWTLEAQPLDDQRARLEAQWEQARGESSSDFWRASLEDNKVEVEVGGVQELGPVRTEYALEQEWQEELQNRRASISLTLPKNGWEAGLASSLDWRSAGEEDWQVQSTAVRGWLATPKWFGWHARATWAQNDTQQTSGLALASEAQRLEAEVTSAPGVVSYTGRVSQRVGPGVLVLERNATRGEDVHKRWLARYQCRLATGARISAQGSRRWSELLSTYEDKVEAQLELSF
jgi:hypothetical protein